MRGPTESIAPGDTQAQADAQGASFQRSAILWVTNISHALNHFQNQMVSVLYPVIMADLGFGYAQLGVLSAVRSLLGSATQGFYGFLAPFFRRTHVLGVGNLVLGLGTLLTGFAGSFTGFLAARGVAAVGSSAQHPVGMSLLSEQFPKNRGTILAFNNSIAGIGSLVAPLTAGLLLLVLGWRHIFFLVAVASVAMGLVYFLFRRLPSSTQDASGTRKTRLAQGFRSYGRVLRNRNMVVISLVMMVGAAGRGGGINMTYLGPHLTNDLGISVTLMAVALTVMQVGGVVGPMGFGWLSDRLSRKGAIQASLLLSALATWWLAVQGAYVPLLFLNLLVYGMVTYSRGTLTQALVADSLSDADRDAAFSAFYFIGFISEPIWALGVGLLMQSKGFTFAFALIGFSYLVGMLLMLLVKEPQRGQEAVRGGSSRSLP